MLVKIILVALLIILSWNTFKVSESNNYLRAQLTELKDRNTQVSKAVLANHEVLLKQEKTIKKNANLMQLNKSLLTKVSKIESQLAGTSNPKKSLGTINETLKNQSNTLTELKKTTDGLQSLKKPIYQIIEMLKKQSALMTKHSESMSSLNVCKSVPQIAKKPIYKKNTVKPKLKAKVPTSLNNVYARFYDTKEQYHNKNHQNAIKRLSTLKSEVWKIRDLELVSKDQVMSVLAAIDVTKKKWESNDNAYDLSQIATKINQLAPKENTIGACK